MLAKKQEVDLRASESKFGDPCGVDRALPQSVITRRKLEWCVFLAAPSPKFYDIYQVTSHRSPRLDFLYPAEFHTPGSYRKSWPRCAAALRSTIPRPNRPALGSDDCKTCHVHEAV